jgi:hypothetical protein
VHILHLIINTSNSNGKQQIINGRPAGSLLLGALQKGVPGFCALCSPNGRQYGTIANDKAYLTGIAKRLWLQHYKASSNNEPLNDFDTVAILDEQLATNKLMHYLSTAGKKCMELLKTYYYDHVSADDVATLFGYSSPHSVTVAKYKCLEKVRETIKQKSLSYADFIE